MAEAVGSGRSGCRPGRDVLDLACGTGDFLGLLAAGRATVAFGMDLSWGMLRANGTGLPSPRRTVRRCRWPPAAVDGITCGYALRNFTELGGSSTSSAGSSVPGVGSACSRWPSPTPACCSTGHRIWFRHVVPVIGGLLSDRAAYRYLPASTAYLPPTAELRAMLPRPDSRRSTGGPCRVASAS